jgi:hypothetical protein
LAQEAPGSVSAQPFPGSKEGRVLGYKLTLITRYRRRITVSTNAGVFTNAAGEPLGILAGARVPLSTAPKGNLTAIPCLLAAVPGPICLTFCLPHHLYRHISVCYSVSFFPIKNCD